MNKFYLLCLLLLIGLLSCNQKSEDASITYIPEPPKPQYDSLAQWLRTPQNLSNPNYKKICFDRFEKEIQRKLYDSAAQTLVNFGYSLIRTEQYDSTFLYTVVRFIREHEKQLSTEYYSRLVYNLGVQYSKVSTSKRDSAVYWYKKTFIKSNNYYVLRNQANAKAMLSWIAMNQGESDSALVYTKGALAIYQQLRDTATQSVAWLSLYNIYFQLNAYNNADSCLNEALKIARMRKDSASLHSCFFNKMQLIQLKKPIIQEILAIQDTLLFAYSDSLLSLYKMWNPSSPYHRFHAYYNPIIKCVIKKDFVQAKMYLDSCRVAAEQVNNHNIQVSYLIIKGFYEVSVGKGLSDIESYKKVLANAAANRDFGTQVFIYKILVSDAKLKENYKDAFSYEQEKHRLRDSLWNEEMRGKIFELEKKYQTAKKEQEIALQKKEISAKNRLIFSLGLSLLALFLIGTIYLLWQKQQAMKKENHRKQAFTNQLFQNTEEERKRIAYDLHDSVGHELLSLKRELKLDISLTDAKIDAILTEVRGISRNLHPVMFDKIGLKISLEDLIDNFQKQHNIFVSTDIQYTAGRLSLQTELQIYRIVQEALSNIHKYAEAKAAKVSIITNPKQISLEIKDNGKGFNVAETLASKKAFGLHSIIERSNTIGGSAQITSSSQGTIILIQIPILT